MKEFKFNTMYDIGEAVVGFDSSNRKLVEFEIREISFDVSSKSVSIWYRGQSHIFIETDVYRNKEEFIESL